MSPPDRLDLCETYLGTVDLIAKRIEAMYPGQGIVVLKVDDHFAKLRNASGRRRYPADRSSLGRQEAFFEFESA
jgi:hypothetical protein